jgi:hypothetical protein
VDQGSTKEGQTVASDTVVRFDTKVVVLLRDDLLPWQELNVTAFLISGIATSDPELIGEPYRDGDGNQYLPMVRQPILILSATADLLPKVREKALSRGISMAIYTYDLFATGHDAANRAAVSSVTAGDLDLVGIALHGPRNVVDRITKGAVKHP